MKHISIKTLLEARGKHDDPMEDEPIIDIPEPPQNGSKRLTGGSPKEAVHYQGSVQPIEIMASIMSKEELRGFLKGNAIKYAYRAGRKEGESGEKDKEKFNVYSKWLHTLETCGTIELPDRIVKVR